MIRVLAIIGVLATLVGCAGGGYDIQVARRDGGLPEVPLTARTDMVVPPGRGAPEAVVLRAFVPGADGWQEVEGARCRITGGEFFRGEAATPSRLLIPDLGPDAPTLSAHCVAGRNAGEATVGPLYAWPSDRRPSAPRRIAWGGGWWWGMQTTGPLSYPDLSVGMR